MTMVSFNWSSLDIYILKWKLTDELSYPWSIKGLKQTLTSVTEPVAFSYPLLFENNSYINQVLSFQCWVLGKKQLLV